MPLAFIADRTTAMAQRVDRSARLGPRDALLLVRWVTLALLLGLAFLEPQPTRLGWPTWTFILLFAAYSLPVDILGRRHDWIRFRLQPFLDLVIAGMLYLLNTSFDGAVYTLVFLAVVSAAATLPLRSALFYVVVSMLILIGFELILRHPWSPEVILQDVGVRMLRVGLVAFVAAILARRLTLEQLATRQAQHEAEHLAELDRLRGTFVAAVSHDLQTPLTAIRAGLGLLEASAGTRLRDDEVQLLSNARRNVDRLGLQINDLLSLNQLEAGQFPLTASPFDLRAAIVSAVAVTHPLTEQKGQVLEVAVDRPLLVVGDQRRLEQALVNLVANAHYHTPPGTRITIGGWHTADGVELQVSDNGPGIPQDAREQLFDRFYRADAATAGSGLGLNIAKAIVERHGGRLWVESAPGQGATFSALLPPPPIEE
jgi:signal transduction histidine kinase